MLATADNPRAVSGNNNPPPASALNSAKDALTALSAFLKEYPVIQGTEAAKRGADFIKATRNALADARAARDAETAPFNDKLAKIRKLYDIVRDKTKTNAGGALEQAYNLLRKRMTDYADAVETARRAEADRLRREAEEKERIAREAEAQEQDAIASAEVGECTDVGAAIEHADATFTDFRRADRQAVIAERSVPVRLVSTLGGPVVSMRTVEVLFISNIADAIKEIIISDGEIPPKLADAVLSCARDYRKAHGELPAGIGSKQERSI